MPANNSDRFSSVVSAVLGVAADQIDDTLSPDSVDTWDSLNQINLVSALEQEFGVTFVVDDLGRYQSVVRLKALLKDHGVAV